MLAIKELALTSDEKLAVSSLWLTGNALQTISPLIIDMFPNLDVLNVNSPVQYLPANIASLKSLRALRLGDNHLGKRVLFLSVRCVVSDQSHLGIFSVDDLPWNMYRLTNLSCLSLSPADGRPKVTWNNFRKEFDHSAVQAYLLGSVFPPFLVVQISCNYRIE